MTQLLRGLSCGALAGCLLLPATAAAEIEPAKLLRIPSTPGEPADPVGLLSESSSAHILKYPELLHARERQAQLLQGLPGHLISPEDTANYSRTQIRGVPPALADYRIESESDVEDLLDALAPYLALTAHEQFSTHVHRTSDGRTTYVVIQAPNGIGLLPHVIVISVDQETHGLRSIFGIFEHAVRLPTEPPMLESTAISIALDAVDSREAYALSGHQAHLVYWAGEDTCLTWRVELQRREPRALEGGSEADSRVRMSDFVFVLGDGTSNVTQLGMRCPTAGDPTRQD